MPEIGLKRGLNKKIEKSAMFYIIVLVIREADVISIHYSYVQTPYTIQSKTAHCLIGLILA